MICMSTNHRQFLVFLLFSFLLKVLFRCFLLTSKLFQQILQLLSSFFLFFLPVMWFSWHRLRVAPLRMIVLLGLSQSFYNTCNVLGIIGPKRRRTWKLDIPFRYILNKRLVYFPLVPFAVKLFLICRPWLILSRFASRWRFTFKGCVQMLNIIITKWSISHAKCHSHCSFHHTIYNWHNCQRWLKFLWS